MEQYVCFTKQALGEAEGIVKKVCVGLEKTKWGADCVPTMITSMNKYPHITIQTMNGTPPVYSNTLLSKTYDESVRVVEIQTKKPLSVKLAIQWK